MEIEEISANATPGAKSSCGSFRLAIIEHCEKTYEGGKNAEIKEMEREIEKAEASEAALQGLQRDLLKAKAKERRRISGVILLVCPQPSTCLSRLLQFQIYLSTVPARPPHR